MRGTKYPHGFVNTCPHCCPWSSFASVACCGQCDVVQIQEFKAGLRTMEIDYATETHPAFLFLGKLSANSDDAMVQSHTIGTAVKVVIRS